MILRRKLAIFGRLMVVAPTFAEGALSRELLAEAQAALFGPESLYDQPLPEYAEQSLARFDRIAEEAWAVVLATGHRLRRARAEFGLPLPIFLARHLPDVSLDLAELLSEVAYAERLLEAR